MDAHTLRTTTAEVGEDNGKPHRTFIIAGFHHVRGQVRDKAAGYRCYPKLLSEMGWDSQTGP